jgi:phage terminase large subunit
MSEFSLSVFDGKGEETVIYEPLPHQIAYHASNSPNLLALGTRGTGKSLQLRMDAILRCLMIPNFKALIIRRTMPELRKSHLGFIDFEMKLLGGKENGYVFLHTTFIAKFPNGSTLTFGHCETEADILDYLSSEYGFIGFDELSTFTLNQFLQISAAARAPKAAPYKAVVRAGTNPLGIGADWLKAWFVDKNVRLEDYPDYHPDDFEMIFSTLADNPHLDEGEYAARLKNLPEHVRRAWLKGEFVTEGAYFEDFRQFKMVQRLDADGNLEDTLEDESWHVIDDIPLLNGQPLFAYGWINIYRAIDWGYSPDPAVCLWIAVLPNKTAIVFKERTWNRTLAEDVSAAIKRESIGLHVLETFCDPTMFIKTGVSNYSIGEIFENNGVPLSPSVNRRDLFGYSIHQHLNTIIDQKPQLQIVRPLGIYGCPQLIRTLPNLRTDPNDPTKIAEGEDHWAIALAYFCMGQASPSRDPIQPEKQRWLSPKRKPRSFGAV